MRKGYIKDIDSPRNLNLTPHITASITTCHVHFFVSEETVYFMIHHILTFCTPFMILFFTRVGTVERSHKSMFILKEFLCQ